VGNQWIAGQLREWLEPLFAKFEVDMVWVRVWRRLVAVCCPGRRKR
jgi:hypothetical protein